VEGILHTEIITILKYPWNKWHFY